MGGSAITGATDGFDAGMSDIAPAPDGWGMKTLFRDWGDTAGTGDGGYETGAIVVKNLGAGTSQPFDGMLAGLFANGGAPYAFMVDRDADGTMDTVAFAVDTMGPPAGSNIDAGATGSAALSADVGGLAADASIRSVTGSYRGARGTYTCGGQGQCPISRATGGATLYTLGAGMWQFTPAVGAMITVPDQDWMVYGAWMTTPDDTAGTQAIGTLFNGFDTYAGANGVFTAGTTGLNGTATYSGGAAGIYVDGTASGLFTAEATLTANFDVNANGNADPAPANDYSISGRIDNFRGTDGVFLGGDTQASPNDPMAGGENDWVVQLSRVQFSNITNGIIAPTATTGSADGVPWGGMWNGQLFGPGDTAMNATPPTGVAGQFNAATTMPPDTAAGLTAVVGAFGADRDD